MIKKNLINHNWDILRNKISDEKQKNLTVLPVTKTVGIEEIKELISLGFNRFAENRLDLAMPKIEALRSLNIKWDFIGNIQSRKVSTIVENFELIHSVSNLKTAKNINKAASSINKVQEILLQINIAEEPQKSGFTIEEITDQFQSISILEHIQVNGLMAMAPLTSDTSKIKSVFAKLKKMLTEFQSMTNDNFKELSMGMSNDYLCAIEEGSTILRIGTAFFKEQE
ncbi:MAG: YggS family pyridoxal phosphate-dependent enzyme [Planctomycetota bacterium]|nr:MAG: YggS family pyridoxal phosphate-dependent enzyme [Planctomycetota bacterium]